MSGEPAELLTLLEKLQAAQKADSEARIAQKETERAWRAAMDEVGAFIAHLWFGIRRGDIVTYSRFIGLRNKRQTKRIRAERFMFGSGRADRVTILGRVVLASGELGNAMDDVSLSRAGHDYATFVSTAPAADAQEREA